MNKIVLYFLFALIIIIMINPTFLSFSKLQTSEKNYTFFQKKIEVINGDGIMWFLLFLISGLTSEYPYNLIHFMLSIIFLRIAKIKITIHSNNKS